MSEVNKQRLKEYQTSYRNAGKINKKSWFFVNHILLKTNFIYGKNQLILMK